MSIKQEKESRKEELARLGVPRVSIDLMSDELTGRQKLTVMKYLMLEDSLSALGLQKFGRTTTDNISLKPVRDWATQHWSEEFVLDMSKRNIPISFRASLGLALFTTRITEHLADIDGGVEIYVTRDIKKVFRDHKLPEPEGLVTIDYSSLPPKAKADLVLPIMDNLLNAQIVAQAKALFPNGIPTKALYFADMSSIMTLGLSGNKDEVIKFDKIRNLEIQVMAADIALRNLGRMGDLIAWADKADEEEKARKARGEKREEISFNAAMDYKKEPDLHYEEGTRFTQVFPFREGETPEQMLQAFKRITKGQYYDGSVDESHRGEYLRLHINREGRLIGHYGWDKGFAYDQAWQIEIDMLSGKLDNEYTDNNRRKTVRGLVADLRDDMDANKQARDLATSQYRQTSFTVEMGFLQAMTGEYRQEATEAEVEEDKRLAREAKKTAAQLSEEDVEQISIHLARISEKPVDMKTVELDFRILSAIREHYNIDPMQLVRAMSSTEPIHIDNIGKWFEGCSSLLNRYQSVVVDIGQLFVILGIPPTNDEKAIISAYRKITMQTHPDKTIEMQPEERVAAEQKFQRTTEAYGNIIKRVGKVNTNRLSPTYYLGRISQLFQVSFTEE
ncbi:MAG: DnaJ domain-containing protein [Patescibacteria group bacterium]